MDVLLSYVYPPGEENEEEEEEGEEGVGERQQQQ